ncbi:hypothetical protein BM1_04771 [Bipolaris maydis]|nr:hypothetical protein BM1_04771 [Bipolaris maydis]
MPSHVISPRDDHPSRQDPKWFPNFLSSYPGSESFSSLSIGPIPEAGLEEVSVAPSVATRS